MAYRFYETEEKYNKDLYDTKISLEQAQLLVNKLCRHFKFRKVKVYQSRTRGTATSRYINLPKITTVGLTIHEIAHVFYYWKHRNFRHTNKLHTVIKRFSAYFRKNLISQFEVLKLPKQKPKPTSTEKYKLRLERTEKSIKRLSTKIKTLKTRLRTAKKKQTYLKRQLRSLK